MLGDQYIRHQFVPEGAVSADGRDDQVMASFSESVFPGETFRVLKEKEVKQFGDTSRRTKISFEYGEYNVLVNSPIRPIDCRH